MTRFLTDSWDIRSAKFTDTVAGKRAKILTDSQEIAENFTDKLDYSCTDVLTRSTFFKFYSNVLTSSPEKNGF